MITTQKLINFLAALILSLHFFHAAADAKSCSTSACGAIRNISFPFRLKGDRNNCGDPRYELTCENSITSLFLNSIKYHVKEINYYNYTIRVVDASINNDTICSFPIHSSYTYNFTHPSSWPYYIPSYFRFDEVSVNLISCPNPLHNSSLFTDITQYCATNLSHPRFRYVNIGRIMASEVPHTCGLDLIEKTTWPGFVDSKNVSLSQIHQSLLYGFDLYFCYNCNEKPKIWGQLLFRLEYNLYLIIPLAILVFIIAGVSLLVTIFIGIAGLLLLSFTSFREGIQNYDFFLTLPAIIYHLGTKDNHLSFGIPVFDLQIPKKALVLFRGSRVIPTK
ncbi:LEAF RUST 10 DISEASE-RESISTANCE LOCUS RECEPTOR-LIKE PROTEIN KINASE-like 2.1 isoform X2 [Salvia divinorum]|uniref:LEAF RUST 10 DISEASE-RESISTANCE LOCUS RECEPTOR-LIKE PROTEIN KINASE-like 2.1 isoform X2 n=1 Tax=Salvia divinorum TaxID=28513 RepID=A0ABD1FJJ2_SALDI